MNWFSLLSGAVGGIAKVFLWFFKRSDEKKAARKAANEKTKEKIDKDKPVGDVQSGVDDILNSL